MAALTEGGRLEPFTITRRALKPTDVAIQIKYAGVCHSDIHQARGEWSKGGGESGATRSLTPDLDRTTATTAPPHHCPSRSSHRTPPHHIPSHPTVPY